MDVVSALVEELAGLRGTTPAALSSRKSREAAPEQTFRRNSATVRLNEKVSVTD